MIKTNKITSKPRNIGIIAIILLIGIITPVFADQILIPVTQDAFVDEANPDTNYGTATYLMIRTNGTTGLRTRAYLVDYDLSVIPANSTITSAYLRLYASGYSGTFPRNYRLGYIMSNWTETGITWNNQPSVDTSSPGYYDIISVSATSNDEWDITNIIKDEYEGKLSPLGTDWYGLYIRDDQQYDSDVIYKTYYSYDYGTNTPVIVVNYNPPATTPTIGEGTGDYIILEVYDSDTKEIINEWGYVARWYDSNGTIDYDINTVYQPDSKVYTIIYNGTKNLDVVGVNLTVWTSNYDYYDLNEIPSGSYVKIPLELNVTFIPRWDYTFKIVDSDGNPIQGAEITAQNDRYGSYDITTNNGGYATLTLPSRIDKGNTYRITITATGYVTFTTSETLYYSSERVYAYTLKTSEQQKEYTEDEIKKLLKETIPTIYILLMLGVIIEIMTRMGGR